MQINPIMSYNCNSTQKQNNVNPSFRKVINVSDVILDNKSLPQNKQFNLLIDRAVKYLKKVENQGIDFVKNFWKTADSYDTKNLQRTSHYMVTSQDARILTRASHDIAYKGGDKTEYLATQKCLLNDSLKRIKENGKEQELFIKAHSEKKKIIIDEIGFKNKGDVVSTSKPAKQTIKEVSGVKYDEKGQGLLDFGE